MPTTNNSTSKYLDNCASFGGGKIVQPTNTPSEYKDRKKQYLAQRTRLFANERAYLSTDYMSARAQGLYKDDFYRFKKTNIRLADITAGTVVETRRVDDWKEIFFPDLTVDYFPLGAKVETMGSTWLCVNPSNLTSVNASGLVARCNSSYNSYDKYGNVVTEPILVENIHEYQNNNVSREQIVLMEGNYKITCQLNDNTRKLRINQRLIIGTDAYHITGFNDFIQEFTGNRGSVHLLTFTARLEEPTKEDDITENFIANGNAYTFGAELVGRQILPPMATTITYTPHFIVNGEIAPASAEMPLNWIFASSDKTILEIDENGVATRKGIGTATLTATLEQNPNIVASLEVEATSSIATSSIDFGAIPSEITQYESITLTPTFYQGRGAISVPFEWEFSGASEQDYYAVVSADKKSAEIYCKSASDVPLTVKVSYSDFAEQTAVFDLIGY